jgi:4-hydroxy-tetrahydrodipicolinate reductase
MTKVAVSGAAGRMGGLVAETVAAEPGLELVAAYDPVGSGDAGGIPISRDPGVVAAADVVVEFTVPDVVLDNLERWRSLDVHAVVGTSGFDVDRIESLREAWGSGPPNCLVVPNFSVGAVLMMTFAEMAAKHYPAAEIVELHHDRKADAPSGTALATAARMDAAGGRSERTVESDEMVEGSRGGDVPGARVHSVRLPGLLAHQEVLLGAPGELLTIRHDTTDRVSFMPGVLLAIRGVADLPQPVTVGLEALLF